MKKFLKYLIIALLLVSGSVFTQSEKSNTLSNSKTYLTFGLGLSDVQLIDWYGKPSFGISFNYAKSNHLIKSRYYYNELNSFMAEVPINVWDLGILYGYCKNFSFTSLTLSAGISLVNYSYSEYLGLMTYNPKSIFTVGFPFEAQLNWLVSKKIGMGISLFGDLNSKKSFYGVLLNFSFGKVR